MLFRYLSKLSKSFLVETKTIVLYGLIYFSKLTKATFLSTCLISTKQWLTVSALIFFSETSITLLAPIYFFTKVSKCSSIEAVKRDLAAFKSKERISFNSFSKPPKRIISPSSTISLLRYFKFIFSRLNKNWLGVEIIIFALIFVLEEDVPSEENTFIPPRPPKRIYNADGTITDPELERIKKEEAERIAEEKRLAKEAKKAAEEAEKTEDNSDNSDSEENNGTKEGSAE